MTKRILICAMLAVLILSLAGCDGIHIWQDADCVTAKTCKLCGEVDGKPLGHTWKEMGCNEKSVCKVCNAVSAEPLAHDWQEATTEAPKTCARCQLTEGEKLITDSRFTTAATKELQGAWFCNVTYSSKMLGLGDGFERGADCIMKMEFGNTGELICTTVLQDEKAFMEEYRAFLKQFTYDMLGKEGEAADKALKKLYGLTVEEYVNTILNALNLKATFQAMNSEDVYYVKDGKLYTAASWKSKKFTGKEYTLSEDDILVIDGLSLEKGGEPLKWTRLVNAK